MTIGGAAGREESVWCPAWRDHAAAPGNRFVEAAGPVPGGERLRDPCGRHAAATRGCIEDAHRQKFLALDFPV
jgi:hypothetical protein